MSIAPFPQGTLGENEMKQQLSIAYIRAVAATAGMQIMSLDVDYDGIDLTIRSFVKYPHVKGSQIDIQLKCTSREDLVSETHVSYPLRREIYEDYNDPERYQPGMLAILVVPGSFEDWLDQDEDRLLARGCMYYSVGGGWPALDDSQQSKTVKCARADILDAAKLRELMQLASDHIAGVFS